MKTVEDYIVTIPDFPEPGIMFRDVTGVLDDAEGLKIAIDELYKKLDGVEYDVIAGAEARGFIFGMPLAYKAGKHFVPIRKKGKLPRETVEKTYDLEYGTATIEIHKNSIKPVQNCIYFFGMFCIKKIAKNNDVVSTLNLFVPFFNHIFVHGRNIWEASFVHVQFKSFLVKMQV